MIVLLAPSESKVEGGDKSSLLNKDSLLFPLEYHKRLEITQHYNQHINSCEDSALCQLFGIKDIKKAQNYKKDIFTLPTMKAIQRYTGVAFDYISYNELPTEAQEYIDKQTILFSNLFGPILAKDRIPNYKLKQGEKLEGIAIEAFYKKHFSALLENYLENEDILDLRAGFYDKFYKPNKPYTTLKFLKEGKVVSHWAKAYRGIVLKALALNNVQTLEDFENLNIDGLKYVETKTTKLKSERIYTIIS
jgi:uncharacterized protein